MQAASDSVSHKLAMRRSIMRVPNSKVELFHLKGFLSPQHCQDLITLIDKDRHPSTIADSNNDVYFRTSETCDFAREESAVQKLEELFQKLNGIDPMLGEPVQGQRYDVGQEFKAHTDYFTPGTADFEKFCSTSGQRSWTFMIYLNEVEAGGATRFKVVGKIFQPEVGKLVCWNNRRSNGEPNPDTLHHGMKVRKGVKYVVTKWYRERPWPW
ncbi:MAG: 2OG-Fe(II) oxygenase [Pseudomonadota bacterium]